MIWIVELLPLIVLLLLTLISFLMAIYFFTSSYE
jgi:hypothetical protein